MQNAVKSMLQKICGIVRRLKLNNLKTRVVLIYVLNMFDLIATTVWVQWFGLEVEANPIARWMFSTNSIYVYKALIVAIGLYFLNRFLPQNPKFVWTTWLLLVVYGAIAIYHLIIAAQLIIIFTRI